MVMEGMLAVLAALAHEHASVRVVACFVGGRRGEVHPGPVIIGVVVVVGLILSVEWSMLLGAHDGVRCHSFRHQGVGLTQNVLQSI